MAQHVLLIGTSHRTAPVEARELLALDDHASAATVTELLSVPGVQEAVVISTCNRVEIVTAVDVPDTAARGIRRWVESRTGERGEWFDRHMYVHQGRAAVEHLFRVSSSLDSLIVGEPQIVGQVKNAFQVASATGGPGTMLHRTFQHAFHTAKRVRSETQIAEHAVSVSYAAVELAGKVFDSLAGRQILVIGAGKMGALAVSHLQAAGAGTVRIANRSIERAREAAARFGGTAHGLDELERLLEQVDIVISSTGSQNFIVRYDMLKACLARRKYRPLFLIDIAVPRDIDPRCEGLSNVYLFDVDDLGKVVEENMRARRAEAVRAEAIVREEADRLERWFAEHRIVPTIVSLREKLNRLREAEVQRMVRSHPGISPEAVEAADRMAQALVNKILHEPTLSLREASGGESASVLASAVRSLFRLGDEPEPAPERAAATSPASDATKVTT